MGATVGVEISGQLTRLRAALDDLAGERDWQLPDDQLLQRIDELGRMTSRMAGIRMRAIAEASRRKVCEQQGWTLPNHLVAADPQPLKAARATVRLADRLHRFPAIGDALAAGCLSLLQAGAITRSLDELPGTTPPESMAAAQSVMVEQAAQFDAAGLRRIGNHLVDVICPDTADDKLSRQLTRQELRAQRDRFLCWQHTGEGSITFRGQLPVIAGEAFISQVDAYVQRARAVGLDRAIDPQTDIITNDQRRADGLLALVADVQARQLAPTVAGDRPRAVITLQYQDLVAGIRGGALIGSGESISPGAARRIACSGELVPAVLGGPSVVLDVGRSVRLFSGMLRSALVLRDGGCVFPGCDAPPARCEGHHIIPWWAGGRTALDNGVLVCGHHHDLVEPDPQVPPGSRWEIRLDRSGLPEVLPPCRIDSTRRPRQHARFTERIIRQRR